LKNFENTTIHETTLQVMKQQTIYHEVKTKTTYLKLHHYKS